MTHKIYNKRSDFFRPEGIFGAGGNFSKCEIIYMLIRWGQDGIFSKLKFPHMKEKIPL